MTMKRLHKGLLYSLLLATLIGLGSCAKEETGKGMLDREEAERIAVEYQFIDKDGLHLRLSEKEAAELGISHTDYVRFLEMTKDADNMFRSQLDSLGEGERMNLYWSIDKIDTTGMDKRYIIRDLKAEVVIDMMNPDATYPSVYDLDTLPEK